MFILRKSLFLLTKPCQRFFDWCWLYSLPPKIGRITVYLIIKPVKSMATAGKLTNVQLELLKLFQYDLPERQLTQIKIS